MSSGPEGSLGHEGGSLPPYHQRAARATVGIRQHAVDHRTLALTSKQLHSRLLKPRTGHNAC